MLRTRHGEINMIARQICQVGQCQADLGSTCLVKFEFGTIPFAHSHAAGWIAPYIGLVLTDEYVTMT